MREIKFRAWEPLSKKYHYMDFCLYEGEEKKLFALPMGRQSLRDSYTAMNLDNLVIEQFTGLHDKNGKEIYEGDIDEARGICVWIEEDCRWAFQEVETGHQHGLFAITGDFNIIGNIHENPELLNG